MKHWKLTKSNILKNLFGWWLLLPDPFRGMRPPKYSRSNRRATPQSLDQSSKTEVESKTACLQGSNAEQLRRGERLDESRPVLFQWLTAPNYYAVMPEMNIIPCYFQV